MMLHTGHWWTTNTGPACSPPDAFTPGLGERFVSERLRAVGYTSAIFGKWHLGGSKILSWSWESAPKAQGWDYWICGSSANLNACGGSDYTDWQRVDGWASSMETAYQPDALRDAFVVEWPVGPTPKVVYVNLSLAHQPFHSPPGYSPLLPTVAKYNAMVEYADATIGAMLAVVDLQATTVIVLGDNGTPPQVGGPRSKSTCYERGVRVPLIAAGAGVTATGTTNELVAIADIYATVIELGGGTVVTGPYPIDSQSLVPLLAGGSWTPREFVVGGDLWAIPGVKGTRYIVSEDGWKLIQWDTDGDEVVDREELYDLTADPLELIDQLALQPAQAASMRATLAAEALP